MTSGHNLQSRIHKDWEKLCFGDSLPRLKKEPSASRVVLGETFKVERLIVKKFTPKELWTCPPLEPRIENNKIREDPPRAETPIDDEENRRTPIEETPSDNAEGNTTEQKSKKQKKSCRLRDDQEEAEVLEWVEEHPILWNKKHKEYKNKSVKDRIWQDKADGIDTDGFICSK